MYLYKWSLDFDSDEFIPNTIPICARVPQLQVSCWSDDCVCEIRNGLGKYMNRVEPKGFQFSCAKACIEVDLEKGLPLEINLT